MSFSLLQSPTRVATERGENRHKLTERRLCSTPGGGSCRWCGSAVCRSQVPTRRTDRSSLENKDSKRSYSGRRGDCGPPLPVPKPVPFRSAASRSVALMTLTCRKPTSLRFFRDLFRHYVTHRKETTPSESKHPMVTLATRVGRRGLWAVRQHRHGGGKGWGGGSRCFGFTLARVHVDSTLNPANRLSVKVLTWWSSWFRRSPGWSSGAALRSEMDTPLHVFTATRKTRTPLLGLSVGVNSRLRLTGSVDSSTSHLCTRKHTHVSVSAVWTRTGRAGSAEGDSRSQTFLIPAAFLRPQLHLQDVWTVREVVQSEPLPPLRSGHSAVILNHQRHRGGQTRETGGELMHLENCCWWN